MTFQSHQTSIPSPTDLTEDQGKCLIQFLNIRHQFEKRRKIYFITFCIIAFIVLLLNTFQVSLMPAWQIALIVLPVITMAISEARSFLVAKKYKQQLVGLGFPIDFAAFIARYNLKRIEKELVQSRSYDY